MDKAGKTYWDSAWHNQSDLPDIWKPEAPSINNYIQKSYHEFFCQVFLQNGLGQGKKLLEVGCARSSTLPYFAKEFGFKITGIDYSDFGCKMTQAILEREHVNGSILCEDFFAPSEILIEKFDVIVSFGVLEHFQDPINCVTAFAKYLKPGGFMITIIPNLTGILGLIQKYINRPVYEIHHMLDKDSLFKAHQDAGMDVLDCNYFISTNFGICNLSGLPNNTFSWYVKKILLAILSRLSKVVWLIEATFCKFKPTKFLSPNINCVAVKGVGING